MTPQQLQATSAVLALSDSVMGTLQTNALLAGNPAASPPVAGLIAPDTATVGAPAGRIAIYKATFNTAPPVFPSLTYRVAMNVPVKAFEGATSGLPPAPVDDIRIDFEVWANQPGSTVPLVLAVLEQLFRNASIRLPYGGIDGSPAVVFRCEKLSQIDEDFDQKQQKYFGLASYLFRTQR